MEYLNVSDSEVYEIIQNEYDRQKNGIELIARKWAVARSDGGIRRASARIDETRDQGWWNIHYSDRAGVDTSRPRSGLSCFFPPATNVGSKRSHSSGPKRSPRFPDSWFIPTTDRRLMSLLLRQELTNGSD